MRSRVAWAGRLACLALLAFVTYVNYDALVGAFGSGPPYYGRSTNMDKWENPIPTLIVVDAVALVVAFFLLRWSTKALR